MSRDGIISVSDYKPDYIERQIEACPYCGEGSYMRTNRYLYRCLNTKECGRYW